MILSSRPIVSHTSKSIVLSIRLDFGHFKHVRVTTTTAMKNAITKNYLKYYIFKISISKNIYEAK